LHSAELVLNELPQVQVAVISLYSGWIPGFMAYLVGPYRKMISIAVKHHTYFS
jgi:hypothetical protein